MNRERINKILGSIPTQVVVIGLMVIWIVPTLGVFITSFRPVQQVNETGWWTVFSQRKTGGEYAEFCAECHGEAGNTLPEADLSNPEVANRFRRSLQILAMLRRDINGQPHLGDKAVPSPQQAADIADQIQQLAGGAVETEQGRFTIDNYVDALVGYRGTATYREDCADGQDNTYSCTFQDYLNPRGMGQAFVNSLLVTIPATILPILFAAFAGYAFSWLDFRGRFTLFAILVGLQVYLSR